MFATISRFGLGCLGSFESMTNIVHVSGPIMKKGNPGEQQNMKYRSIHVFHFLPPIPIKNPLVIIKTLQALADLNANEQQ
jgi:hypothetical protein